MQILDASAALFMPGGTSGLVESPVKECFFMVCKFISAGGRINPEIERVYLSDFPVPTYPPVTDWTKMNRIGW